MNLLSIVETASSFMTTPGDKAIFERKQGKFISKLIHKGVKRSFVKYDNGTIVETIVHKVISR